MSFLVGWLMSVTTALTTPCLAEDGPGPCFWDAQTRGNGIGQSFVIWTREEL